MNKLEKLMEKKKKDEPMDENYKAAKMSMLKALRDEMSSMMKDDLNNPDMRKVVVSSDNDEGLKAGLDKAKDTLEDMHEPEENEEDAEGPESAEDIIEDMVEHESDEGDLSDEEIEHLEQVLEQAKKKKANKMM